MHKHTLNFFFYYNNHNSISYLLWCTLGRHNTVCLINIWIVYRTPMNGNFTFTLGSTYTIPRGLSIHAGSPLFPAAIKVGRWQTKISTIKYRDISNILFIIIPICGSSFTMISSNWRRWDVRLRKRGTLLWLMINKCICFSSPGGSRRQNSNFLRVVRVSSAAAYENKNIKK